MDITLLTAGATSSNLESYATASHTIPANRSACILFSTSDQALTPTVSGHSRTWTVEGGVGVSGRGFWFAKAPSAGSDSTDTLTIAHTGDPGMGATWHVFHGDADVDPNDFYDSASLVSTTGTGTNVSVTMGAWDAGNAGLFYHGRSGSNVSTSEWTQESNQQHTSPVVRSTVAFTITEDTSPSATLDISADWSALAVEVAGLGAGPTNLVIQDATHAHSADNQNLTQVHELAIQEATHSQAADGLALTQVHNLITADSLHAHAADNVVLAAEGELDIAGATHAHSADNVALSQVHELVVQEASHGHLAEALALILNLGIQDALHGHTADEIALAQLHLLIIADALHAHTADNVVLSSWAAVARRSTTPVARRQTVAVSRRGS